MMERVEGENDRVVNCLDEVELPSDIQTSQHSSS